MTQTADTLWIKAGVSPRELSQVKGRSVLYAGIATMFVLSLSFAAMTLVNLF